jgi:hypothetical protein
VEKTEKRIDKNGKESIKISKGYIKVNIYSEAPISDIQSAIF